MSHIYKLILILLLLAAGSFGLTLYCFAEIENVAIEKKIDENETRINLLVDRINLNYTEFSQSMSQMQLAKITTSVETMDQPNMEFSAIYAWDGHRFHNVSQRIPSNGTRYFAPTAISYFVSDTVDKIDSRDTCHNIQVLSPENQIFYVTYRWFPAQDNAGSYLICCGFTRHTLSDLIPTLFYVLNIVKFILVSAVCISILLSVRKNEQDYLRGYCEVL